MASSRKRRPQSFDLTPAAPSEPAPSGWTYRSETGASASSAAGAPTRARRVVDWAVWPAEFLVVLLFAPFGARRKP